MADQYVTSQGETWDQIAYNVYGDEAYMKDLIEANPDYAGVYSFESGILIDLPGIPDDAPDEALPIWRTESDAEMDDAEGEADSDEEYYDEDDEDEDNGDYPEEDEGDE